MNRRAFTGLMLAAGIALTATPAAEAKTSKCKAGKYLASITENPIKVSRLRAVDLPSKTDGYAPPCLVADAAAAAIQDASSETNPSSIRLGGARWDGGTWNCTYENATDSTDRSATCRKRGAKRQKITMTLSV